MNIRCPYCQSPMSIDDSFAGQMMSCPQCNRQVQAPAREVVNVVTEPPPVIPTERSPARITRSKAGSIFNFSKFVTPTVVQVIWTCNLVGVGVYVLAVIVYLLAEAMPASPDIDLKTSNNGNNNVEVVAHNLGEFDAKGLIVYIDLPRGATVSGSRPSAGETHPKDLENDKAQLQWEVKRLPVGDSERLAFQVKGGAASRLDVTWESGHFFSQVSGKLLGILGGSLVFCFFYLLNLRLMLETTLILFRMEEHLKDMRESA